jgi:hypothetical protein
MKSLIVIATLTGIVATSLSGCNKNSSSSSSGKPNLILSQSTVARGQQLNASVQNANASTIVKWSIYPTSGAKLFSGSDQATAFFGNSGQYRVVANYYSDSANVPYDSSSSPVFVSDSVYTPQPVQSDTSALAGDQIQIEPITATDTGGLILLVQTVNLYSCYPQLNYYFSQQGNLIELYCLSVASSTTSCNGVTSTAKALVVAPAPANGTYTFDVILNTATYRGSLTVTDGKYVFAWPYSSAVTISPLQIDKQ